MRARLAILLAQQTVELRAIVMQNKPAEMLAMSPKGTVPVLYWAIGDRPCFSKYEGLFSAVYSQS
jgi:glutathione S-transferase